ncbi:MAG: DUF1573 domain-containing protein [Verrucomicrobiota bacterium]|jgi:hypothetical protein
MKSLIRLAVLLAGSAAFPACLCAQTPGGAVAAAPAPAALSTNSLGPRIRFNTESAEAGTNAAGEPIRYTFVITNTGDEMLVLSNVIPGCGCTTVGGTAPGSATTWTHEIAPGQTGVIPVQVDTRNLRGSINKIVTVVSNDRTRSNVTVHITGVVSLPIEVSPAMASFSIMPDAPSQNPQMIKIFNRADTPLTLSDPQSTTNAFSAVLKTNVPGQEFELTVTAAPPSGLPPSFATTVVQGSISLRTSVASMNPLQIGVFETIFPEVTVYPASIQLPAGPLAQASTNHVIIRGNAADLNLFDPGANVPGVDVSVRVIQTNRQFILSAVFPQGFQMQPGQAVALTFKTDNPRFPVLTVPVTPVLAVIRRPPPVPPPARTGVLPASILARVPANSSNAPASSPNPP